MARYEIRRIDVLAWQFARAVSLAIHHGMRSARNERTRRFVVLALLGLFPLATLASEPPPEVKRYFKNSAAARPEFLRLYRAKLDEIERQLPAVEQGKIYDVSVGPAVEVGKGVYQFPSADAKQELIEKLTERKRGMIEVVPALEAEKAWPLYSFKLPMKIGAMGTGGLNVKIERVINAEDCVVTWQPLDDDGIQLWISGLDTSRMVVGEKAVIGNRFELWHVRGTRTKGFNTYLELSRYSLESLRPYLNEGDIFVSYPTE